MADSNFDKASILFPFNGANNGTTFTDYSNNNFAVTTSGTPVTSTAQSKFYGSSLSLNGSSYLVLPNNAAINNFGTGDFTIRMWVYLTAVASEQTFISCGSAWPGTVAYQFEIRNPGDVRFYAGDSLPIQIFAGSGSISANTWTHVEVGRSSGTTRLFVNGISMGTPHSGSVTISNTSSPKVGQIFDNTAPMTGYIQDLEIHKGICLHTVNFTPPPKLTGTISGVVKDDTNANAIRTIMYTPRLVPTATRTTTSASDGTYSVRVADTAHIVTALDDTSGVQYNAITYDWVYPV